MEGRILYLDCFSGISGDMFLGAAVDAGLSLERLRRGLRPLGVKGYRLGARPASRARLRGTHVRVHIDRPPALRSIPDLRRIVRASRLSIRTRETADRILRRLLEAESRIHGSGRNGPAFEPAEALDLLVDVAGACVAIELLGIARVIASPVNLGSGTIESGHGTLPVPSPAAAELLRGCPVYASSGTGELTTPTGAAILVGLGAEFSDLPPVRVEAIGYGAGTRDIPGRPNLLRILIAAAPDPESSRRRAIRETDRVTVIETNLDDMNPQWYEPLLARLLQAGALDAHLSPIIMKGGRPAVALTILASPPEAERLTEIVFRETTTLGVRLHDVPRRILPRRIERVKTPLGPVRVKVAHRPGGWDPVPEFRDLAAIAERTGRPIREVSRLVQAHLSRNRGTGKRG